MTQEIAHKEAQWWKVIKYIFSSTVLGYNFEVTLLEYFNFMLLYTSLHYISEGFIVLFTPLHLFDSYFAGSDY